MPDRAAVVAGFCRAAATYADHAVAQARAADALMALAPPSAATVLDCGCGTGLFTRRLRTRYPAARLVAFDAARPLVVRAIAAGAGGGFVADAACPPLRAAFDLIGANAVLHWLPDPATVLARYRTLLAPGGTLLFAAFGPRTFCELGDALAAVCGPRCRVAAAAFPDAEHWRLALRAAGFAPWLDVQEWREEFPDLLALLRRIKYTGTRGPGLPGMTMTHALLQRIEQCYRDRQAGLIPATWQVVLCRAAR
ncbi:MAG TPA: methyltransferase domain-containing protein [bacterium]|nr:methyltransferase domain-containing protein [bacterium]